MIRKNHVALAAMLVAGALGCGVLRAEVTTEPADITINDAQADLAAGKYAECLTKLNKLLGGMRSTPSLERAMLLVLKAECLLKDKQFSAAPDAFVAAANAYPPKTSKDGKGEGENKDGKYRKEICTANATSALIKRSPDGKYTPTTGKDTTPLSIVDPATRPAALKAFFIDLLATDQVAIERLTHGTGLQAMVDFAPKIQDLEALEFAATGEDKKSGELEKDLAEATKKRLDDWLAEATKRVDIDKTDAAKMVKVTKTGPKGKAQTTQRPAGLTAPQRAGLEGDVVTIEKFSAWFKTVQDSLDLDADYFKQELADAQTLKEQMKGLLGQYPEK